MFKKLKEKLIKNLEKQASCNCSDTKKQAKKTCC